MAEMFDRAVETRTLDEQHKRDDAFYRKQVEYLFARSDFYRSKLKEAGFNDAAGVGGVDDIGALPFTVKDEIRKTQAEDPPLGAHAAAEPGLMQRIFSTSGTTGTPCYIGLTKNDCNVWATNTARSYFAAGFRPGQRLLVTFNAGPFAAGAAYYGFDKLGASVVPVGTGNTERLVKALQILGLGNAGISCTPSYALYLIDWCLERDIDPKSLGIRNIATAGEPGGGDPAIRERVQSTFDCTLREAMGIGDISTSIWGECEHEGGMHFSGRDNTYVELIAPDTGETIPWEDGAEGELIYTSLDREAMPLLRLRSRDHIVVNTQPCACGRSSLRVRCIGRTDDMLIVRGVNLFPTAVRELLNSFRPEVGETFRIKPTRNAVSQQPPLPIEVELGEGVTQEPDGLAERIKKAVRTNLMVTTRIDLVPYASLPREEYKSKLVDFSNAAD